MPRSSSSAAADVDVDEHQDPAAAGREQVAPPLHAPRAEDVVEISPLVVAHKPFKELLDEEVPLGSAPLPPPLQQAASMDATASGREPELPAVGSPSTATAAGHRERHALAAPASSPLSSDLCFECLRELWIGNGWRRGEREGEGP